MRRSNQPPANKGRFIELAVGYREALVERMMKTYEWQRLRGDTSNSMSIDFRPAISNLFFNTSNAFEPPKSRLLELGIQRLDPVIPLLVRCVSSAPSNAVAIFTMNLVEVTFRPSHKPLVLALADACLKEGIGDREFWIGTNIGARICSYFDKLAKRLADQGQIELLAQELDDIVSRLILIGVPEAQRLQDAINADG